MNIKRYFTRDTIQSGSLSQLKWILFLIKSIHRLLKCCWTLTRWLVLSPATCTTGRSITISWAVNSQIAFIKGPWARARECSNVNQHMKRYLILLIGHIKHLDMPNAKGRQRIKSRVHGTVYQCLQCCCTYRLVQFVHLLRRFWKRQWIHWSSLFLSGLGPVVSWTSLTWDYMKWMESRGFCAMWTAYPVFLRFAACRKRVALSWGKQYVRPMILQSDKGSKFLGE
jgi:hypothetical protein